MLSSATSYEQTTAWHKQTPAYSGVDNSKNFRFCITVRPCTGSNVGEVATAHCDKRWINDNHEDKVYQSMLKVSIKVCASVACCSFAND